MLPDGYAVAHGGWGRKELTTAGRTAAKEYLPRLTELAGELRVTLLFGTVLTKGRRCTNAAVLVGPDGTRIGQYDKTHLLDHDQAFDAGTRLPVFDTSVGRVGVMICADRRWPEVARTLRVQGARLLLCPSYGMRHLANAWWMRTRSYENECFLCFAHPTLSLITDPAGEILARRSGRRSGVLVADVDLTAAPTTMFEARRPELYRPIARR